MIIKSLSRKSGGGGQLFNYLFKYMLNEEKRAGMPKHLAPFIDEVRKHKTASAFEKAMREHELMVYHGIPSDTRPTAAIPITIGSFGSGIYLAQTAAPGRKQADKSGTVKKYVVDPAAKLFDAGKNNEHYTQVWQTVLAASGKFTSLSELQDKVRDHLKTKGFAGIKADGQTVLFDGKSITEFGKDFFKQAKYFSGKADIEQQKPRQPHFVLRHNVTSRTIAGYTKEFEANEALRIHKRKDNVHVYHTILSFSNKDTKHVTDEVLKSTAMKYMELRGMENLYVITAHYDRNHMHLHCAMSGSSISGRSARISQAEFASVKTRLADYIRQAHPEIVHSFPLHGKAKQLEAREELKNIKSNERTLDKNILLGLLETTFAKATSREQFLVELKAMGHEPYYRTGILTGIKYENERKFRLGKLGYDEDKLKILDARASEQKALDEIDSLRKLRPRLQEQRLEILGETFEQGGAEIDSAPTELNALRESSQVLENDQRIIEDESQTGRQAEETEDDNDTLRNDDTHLYQDDGDADDEL